MRLVSKRLEPYRQKQIVGGFPEIGPMAGSSSASGLPYDDLPTRQQPGGPTRNAHQTAVDLYRGWRAAIPWVARAIENRRRKVMRGVWDIVRVEGDADENVREQLRDLFSHPDPGGKWNSYARLAGPTAEDYLILDRGAQRAIRPGWPADPSVTALVPMDGGKLTIVESWDGDPEATRYLYDTGDPDRPEELKDRDVILYQANVTTYSEQGLSPMQAVQRFVEAEIDTFRRIHVTQRNSMPPGLLKVPNAPKSTIDKLERMVRQKLRGKIGLGIAALPADAEFMRMGETNLGQTGSFDFYDLIIRGVAAGFNTTTLALNWVQDVNRGTAKQQADLLDEGDLDLMRDFQAVYNDVVIASWGDRAHGLAFRYLQLEAEEEGESVETIKAKAGPIQLWSLNDLAASAGLAEFEYGEELAPFFEYPWVPAPGGQYFLPIPLFAKMVFDDLLRPAPLPTTPPAGVAPLAPPGQPGAPALPAPDGNGNGAIPEGGDLSALTELAAAQQQKMLVGRRKPESARATDQALDELTDIYMRTFESIYNAADGNGSRPR